MLVRVLDPKDKGLAEQVHQQRLGQSDLVRPGNLVWPPTSARDSHRESARLTTHDAASLI